MAGLPDERLTRVGPWPAGIVNLTREDRLPRDQEGRTAALREADNVDLDPSGTPRRRRGRERFYEGDLTHSLWSDDAFPFALFVDAGQLQALEPSGATDALGVLVGAAPVSYALVNDRVFFSNRTGCGMVDVDRQTWAWGPECPAGQPDVALIAGYSMPAGQYQVAVTFMDALGRESGSTLAVAIDLPADHGVELTGIPQPLQATAVNVYLTDANDQVLRLHSTLPAGQDSTLLGGEATGRSLSTDLQFLSPLPAGQIVRLFNGRQLVADGQYLRWSPPLRYGLTNRSRHVIRFSGRIELLEPAGSGGKSTGVYVAAGGRTYWLGGPDPEAWELRMRRSCGAVPGSSCRVPGGVLGMEDGEDLLLWIARDGQYCIGMDSGAIANPKQSLAAVDDAERAAVLFRSEDGVDQVIAAMRGPRPQSAAMRDRAIAHVIHEDPA